MVSSSSSFPVIPVAVGVAVALVLLMVCLILAIVIMRRRKQKENAAEVPLEPVQSKEPTQDTAYRTLPESLPIVPVIASPHAQKRTSSASSSSRSLGGFEIAYKELEVYCECLHTLTLSQFDRELGRGAYGVVYLATYRLQKVAVKKMPVADLTEAQIEEFKRECDLVKSLRPHSNIVTGLCLFPSLRTHIAVLVLGVHTSDPLCTVTEFVAGGSLLDYLKTHDFNDKQVLHIAKDVAAGMAHLHKEGIVHRDLAARNLLVSTDIFPIKITDFGLARLVEGEGAENAKNTRSDVGPLRWMAPESMLKKEYSTKTDVWAYGIGIFLRTAFIINVLL